MLKDYRYDGSRKFKLSEVSTKETSLESDRKKAEARMEKNFEKIQDLQSKLYAEKKEGVIFLFQAMDAAGKDGTIAAVLTCLSPHGVAECAFKSPSSTEMAHDFLWRIEQKTPMKGEIAIFNRSHYEEVLIYRVKKLWKTQLCADRIDPEKNLQDRYEDICNYERYLWHNSIRTVKIFLNVSKKEQTRRIIARMIAPEEDRYEDIRNFERYLWNNSIRTVKIFLNVSKKEQARRFLSRIEEPEKNWKFSASDFEERKYWDEYQEAFEVAINKTATREAPWFVVPADHKWYMRYVVSEIILQTLKDMDPKYPKVTEERLAELEGYKAILEKEIGKSDKK